MGSFLCSNMSVSPLGIYLVLQSTNVLSNQLSVPLWSVSCGFFRYEEDNNSNSPREHLQEILKIITVIDKDNKRTLHKQLDVHYIKLHQKSIFTVGHVPNSLLALL